MKKKQKKDRYTVIYVRVSTDDQAEYGHSLEYQLMVCRERAKSLDLQNIVEFTDDGYSGKSLKRPAIKTIIKMIQTNQVSNLIFYDIDRLSRNMADLLELLDLAKKTNVGIHGINFAAAMNTADERFMIHVKSALSQLESEKISERTIKGLIGGMKKGKYTIPHPPFGYKRYDCKGNQHDPKKGTLVPVREELELVSFIFKLYTVKLLSTEQIATLISVDSTQVFKSNKIVRILRNERYTGDFEFHGTIYSELGFEATITKEMFQAAQARLDNHFKSRKYRYLFYKKLLCNSCGNILNASSSNKKGKIYLYYCCKNTECELNRKLIGEKKVLNQLNKKIIKLYNLHNFTFYNSKEEVTKIKSLKELTEEQLFFFIVQHLELQSIEI